MKDQNPNIPLYVKRYFTEYISGQRNYSLNTIISYRDAIRLFLLQISLQTDHSFHFKVITDFSFI